MEVSYNEMPPEGVFNFLEKIDTLTELNALAAVYEFQLNSVAADENGNVSPAESDEDEYVRRCISRLDEFVEHLGFMNATVEITGMAMLPADDHASTGHYFASSGTFRGEYLGFTARQEIIPDSDSYRIAVGHLLKMPPITKVGWLGKLTFEPNAFVPHADVERIETPEERVRRELADTYCSLPLNDDMASEIDAALINHDETEQLQIVGALFDTLAAKRPSEEVLDIYLRLLNLRSGLLDVSIIVASPYVIEPSQGKPIIFRPTTDIQGISRGFCMYDRVALGQGESQGTEALEQRLHLAVEALSDEGSKIYLVPAVESQGHLIEDDETAAY